MGAWYPRVTPAPSSSTELRPPVLHTWNTHGHRPCSASSSRSGLHWPCLDHKSASTGLLIGSLLKGHVFKDTCLTVRETRPGKYSLKWPCYPDPGQDLEERANGNQVWEGSTLIWNLIWGHTRGREKNLCLRNFPSELLLDQSSSVFSVNVSHTRLWTNVRSQINLENIEEFKKALVC